MKILATVCDVKAKSYNPPVLFFSREDATRAFIDLLGANDGSVPSRHPEDFALFLCGSFDETSGRIEPCVLECLYSGADFLVSKTVEVK